MQLSEVMKETGLTRKAILYYEACGLCRPASRDNGYREFSAQDVSRLKEIQALRLLGLNLAQILKVLDSPLPERELRLLLNQKELQGQTEELRREWLARLAQGCRPEAYYQDILNSLSVRQTILDKLTLAFPDAYGTYIAFHFGRFLGEPIKTDVQKAACQTILDWLDNLPPLSLSPEATELMNASSPSPRLMEEQIAQSLEDVEGFVQKNARQLQEYQAFLASREYLDSPAHEIKQALLAFQRRTGYQEIFLAAMRDLSPAYRAYWEKLQAANESFLRAFPQ